MESRVESYCNQTHYHASCLASRKKRNQLNDLLRFVLEVRIITPEAEPLMSTEPLGHHD